MRAHGGDLRRGRFSESERVYLVTTVVRDRLPIFADWRIGRQLIEVLRAADTAGLCQSIAFVVMPNHLHWLFALGDTTELSSLIRRVKGLSSHRIGRLTGRHWLWQKGFHDHAARRDEDIQNLARYVVANPLRAGLVNRLADYPLWDAIYL